MRRPSCPAKTKSSTCTSGCCRLLKCQRPVNNLCCSHWWSWARVCKADWSKCGQCLVFHFLPCTHIYGFVIHNQSTLRTIEAIITSFGCHLNVELQQRGIEFTQLFRQHGHLRPALLEKMPAMQKASTRNNNNNSPDGENGGEVELLSGGGGGSEEGLKLPAIGADSVSVFGLNWYSQFGLF